MVLETPDKLRQWLSGDGKYQRHAARALADVGPKANAFAPDLLAKLDRDELTFDFWALLIGFVFFFCLAMVEFSLIYANIVL